MLETIVFFLIFALVIAYVGLKYHYNYWKRKQVPYIASNIFDFDWYKYSPIEHYARIYQQLAGHRFGGLYARFTPLLMIRDPELIKRILITDFVYFQDRNDTVFSEHEPISHHLFSAPGPFWRKLRTKMTSMFTSGKLKNLISQVESCAKELSEEIGKQIEMDDVINVKDFSVRYMVEVITLTTFGVKANAIQDKNSEFKQITRNIYAHNPSAKFLMLTQGKLSFLKKFLRLHFTNKPVTEFFNNFVRDMIVYRHANTEKRNDFFQTFMDMKDTEKQKMKQGRDELVMTDELITANSLLFFMAGHETSYFTISLTLYELAINIDIQRRLQEEIDEYLKKNDNNITYEMIRSMPYLHQVLSEIWRKYPVVGTLGRFCVQNYKIPGTEIVIEKGTEVLIPVSGLYSDPEYFPNPEQFDPDRFKDPFSYSGRSIYLPFGLGPRNCIGGRFALINVKLVLIYLLRNFNFETCSATQIPVHFKRFKPISAINHDLLLKCSRK